MCVEIYIKADVDPQLNSVLNHFPDIYTSSAYKPKKFYLLYIVCNLCSKHIHNSIFDLSTILLLQLIGECTKIEFESEIQSKVGRNVY